MSTRAKFVYFILALILAFTGLATATFAAVQDSDLAGWSEVESAGFNSGTTLSPSHTLAEDCTGQGGGGTCP
jgi:hypothetical protein